MPPVQPDGDLSSGNARPAALIVAAVALTILAVVAVVKVGGAADQHVPWAIVESADEGNVLRVAPLVALRPCDGTPKVDLRKSNANRVDLSVSVTRSDCGPDEAARAPRPIDVKLAQPLRGQQITGPELQAPSAYPATRTATATPSVVGFRLPDARAILAAHRLEVARVVGPTDDATEVTSQSPPAGTTRAPAEPGRVALRTVPR